jgi:hypothetical protein
MRTLPTTRTKPNHAGQSLINDLAFKIRSGFAGPGWSGLVRVSDLRGEGWSGLVRVFDPPRGPAGRVRPYRGRPRTVDQTGPIHTENKIKTQTLTVPPPPWPMAGARRANEP